MEMISKSLVLFSGGRDSFFCVCLIQERSQEVHVIHFFPVASIGDDNILTGVERLQKRYSPKKIRFAGQHTIAGIWREFILPLFHLKPSKLKKEYGEFTLSQMHCLLCRSAMYTYSIMYCKHHGITHIVDGGRESQGFAIELKILRERFQSWCNSYDITLEFPLAELEDDRELKHKLLRRGFIPKVYESQCLMGVHLCDGKPPSLNEQRALMKYFDLEIIPRANTLLGNQFPTDPITTFL